MRHYPSLPHAAVILALCAVMAGCATDTSPSLSATAAPVTIAPATPTPEAPPGTNYHNYCVLRSEMLSTYEDGNWKTNRTAGYVADMPGFPLPLFSDPEKRDATTAHLYVCDPAARTISYTGNWDQGTLESRFEFADVVFYYDPTPEGDFGNLDTFCSPNKDAVKLGGDRTIEPGHWKQQPWGHAQVNAYAETIVDRSVPVTGPDGAVFDAPSPERTRWRVMAKGRGDVADGMSEVWVFDYVQDENGSE